MKTINKTTLAIAFSVLGALSSMSAIAMSTSDSKEHQIEVIADGDKDVQVFVKSNGEVADLVLSEATLNDLTALKGALSVLPEDLRDKVAEQLGNIHVDADMIKIHSNSESISTWTDGNAEQVFVFEIEEESSGSNIAKKIVKEIKHDGEHKVIQIKKAGHVGPDLIMKLLEKGEFTVDDLDNIQQALDAKR
ncbi:MULTISPECIES: hypothetical protein [Thalassotalea]|uniref:hypothetical protein n=1 Tax=Thalassotalea TaxID=1518149 RepID=UPI0009434AA7|nr:MULTISPECIES: hypothetical protein [Thalassotalea]OKY24782.1 hypothetical protein BI291_04985 [Thalassotalea sp. PP2-459]